jgi:hypothetical protein
LSPQGKHEDEDACEREGWNVPGWQGIATEYIPHLISGRGVE